ncbi:hypothetical protein J7K52_02515 [Candidatus Bathyarchaeota archaeon]|nr:hypothetical protein [Candidatus Bathyarchaeota archaeon]
MLIETKGREVWNIFKRSFKTNKIRVAIVDMEVYFETDSYRGSWDVTKPIISKLKIRQTDIEKIEPAYFAISNSPYEEENVARCTHPCEGSIGFYVYTNDGNKYLTEEIFYYDYNLKKSHYNGLPHWNHEVRLNGHLLKDVPYHQIPDAPYIKLMVIDGNKILYEKTVKRVPISEVRKGKISGVG